jgi:hypothetical protein
MTRGGIGAHLDGSKPWVAKSLEAASWSWAVRSLLVCAWAALACWLSCVKSRSTRGMP